MAKKQEQQAPPIYQLKVTLDNIQPPIWRRLQVPADTPLDVLHVILQFAMGWEDAHLHSFEIGGKTYTLPDEDGGMSGGSEVEDLYTLGEVVPGEGASFKYTYDFGDTWEHTLVVEKTLPPDPDIEYPICLEGARACPPEDIGGAIGYLEMLAAWKDRKHPDHHSAKEWIEEWMGEDFDPEEFSVDVVNDELANIEEYLAEMAMLNDSEFPLMSDDEVEAAYAEGNTQLAALILETQPTAEGMAFRLAPHPLAVGLACQLLLMEHSRLDKLKFTLEVGPRGEQSWLRVTGARDQVDEVIVLLKRP